MFTCRRLRRIERKLDLLLERQAKGDILMAKSWSDVADRIRKYHTVHEGLMALFSEMHASLATAKAQVQDVGGDTTQIDESLALLDEMEREGGAAITAGTAAADEEAPPATTTEPQPSNEGIPSGEGTDLVDREDPEEDTGEQSDGTATQGGGFRRSGNL